MKHYYVEPEVAGGFGPETVMDLGPRGMTVTSLHYVFDGWLGDAILESTPCFIVTEELARQIAAGKLTGATIADVRISRSETFDELQGETELPAFVWLKICGMPNSDDFFMAEDGRLVVSARAWKVISPVAQNAVIAEYTP